jgi:hypothetical protein
MNAVIEVNVIWQVVHPIPLDWLTGLETYPHRFKHRTLIPDLAVACHASFRGREIGKGRSFHGLMTVTAVDAIVYHVMLMAEGDRLLNGILDPNRKR